MHEQLNKLEAEDITREYFKSGKAELQVAAPFMLIEAIKDCPDFKYRVPMLTTSPSSSLNEKALVLELIPGNNFWEITIQKKEQLVIRYGDTRLLTPLAKDRYLPRDLAWLILPVLERSRQENEQYLVHAAAIEKNGRGAVFFGPTHAGKTSLVSTFAFRYGCNVIGTEHTLLGIKGIEGGTHWLEVYRGLKQFIPELPISQPKEPNIWNKANREALDMVALGKYSPEAELTFLVYMSVVHEAKDLQIYEWSPRKTMVHLGEWMRWMIHGSQSFLWQGSAQFPSLDTVEISKRRMALINHLISQGKRIFFMKGTADSIAKEILSRL